MEGYLLVDNPEHWTSFDVVGYVRRKVAKLSGVAPKKIKVGHSGTLDPFATGLLIILVGKAYTTQAASLLKLAKTYQVTMRLDASSTTGDTEGEIIYVTPPESAPNEVEIKAAMRKLTGDIDQVPPAFSAIKINGVRAYKLARSHQSVTIAPRRVTIHALTLTSYDYPEIRFEARVSSGTYIRTLVEDLARSLNRQAYTKELRRTSIDNYSIADAIKVEAINEQNIGSLLRTTLIGKSSLDNGRQ